MQKNERDLWFHQDATTAILLTQQLSCRTYSMIALSAVGFGHHGLQTLGHLTCLFEDFLQYEYTALTQEA
jgi:hypothetical protein